MTQIYPNPTQTAVEVQANRSLLIPDMNNPNSFLIESTKAGSEEVFCVTSQEKLVGKVPAKFTGGTLEPIPGVFDMHDVKAAFMNTSTSPKLVGGVLPMEREAKRMSLQVFHSCAAGCSELKGMRTIAPWLGRRAVSSILLGAVVLSYAANDCHAEIIRRTTEAASMADAERPSDEKESEGVRIAPPERHFS